MLEEAEAHFMKPSAAAPLRRCPFQPVDTLVVARRIHFFLIKEEYEWGTEARRGFFRAHVCRRSGMAAPRWTNDLLYSEQGSATLSSSSGTYPFPSRRQRRRRLPAELKRCSRALWGNTDLLITPKHFPSTSMRSELAEALSRDARQHSSWVPNWPDAALTAIGGANRGRRYAESRLGMGRQQKPSNDRNRSCRRDAAAQASSARLLQLQKRNRTAIDRAPEELRIIDKTAELTDFAYTAALIANLDLVISVDTSVSHLAGAIGKPVWTPSRTRRVGVSSRQGDGPWYPSMRLSATSGRLAKRSQGALASLSDFEPQPWEEVPR
jgi:hypothetical protein